MSSLALDAGDIADWLEELGLEKRKVNFTKNVPAACADGVLVADIIHAMYPKMIQIHSYSETNSIQSRKENWRLLSRKVLKHLRCEVTEDDIDIYATRKSGQKVIEYLRMLRAKLPAYEPFYLSGQYNNDAGRQARASAFLASSGAPPPVPELSDTTSTPARSRQNSGRFSTSSHGANVEPGGPRNRRPSMIKSEKILKERQKVVSRASKKAAGLSEHEIDALYIQYAKELKKSAQELAMQSDELDHRSAIMDAKIAALRQQNKDELLRIEKRIAQTQITMAEAEMGREIVGVDDRVIDHLSDTQKDTNLKGQLRKQFHRASITIGTPESVWYNKDTSPVSSAGKPRRKSDNPRASVSSKATPSPKKGLRTPQLTPGSIPATPDLGQSRTEDSDVSPLTVHTKTFSPDGRLSIEGDDESDSDESDIPPPPPPQSEENDSPIKVANDSEPPALHAGHSVEQAKPDPPPAAPQRIPTVDFIRHFSAEYGRFFYMRTSVGPGEEASQWIPPTSGVVQCRDDSTGRDYYTDSSTGKSAWVLSDLC
mmetsp:Transcript_8957/g.13466  ORF Transcript_8957/g.13466 Transcript_8957/m.13466 type:complete len:541 (+) Transcript_8957:105-1727(+)|eukprot:CAMPEP_0185032526 /NCGR_PEP_ID=MMETSP1103-20130426/20671_1 /TAXON_ID=36769 /ORGANISM="Paraphysomonas bandaiensis, Strain Caron Lab Isolate" /LENGTH=540 /DNA_ID=CAMNT_0027568459 /DNA_START=25 /DNA_END=1647 /DNA_ORIENTATION=-